MTRAIKWSHTEKRIARKAFEQVLERELEVVIRTAKGKAGKIEQPADLWDVECYMTQSHKEIDRKQDYRYSVLTEFFGNLVRESRFREKELARPAEG